MNDAVARDEGGGGREAEGTVVDIGRGSADRGDSVHGNHGEVGPTVAVEVPHDGGGSAARCGKAGHDLEVAAVDHFHGSHVPVADEEIGNTVAVEVGRGDRAENVGGQRQ